LGCAALSGVLWLIQPRLGGWPLVVGLLPWAARLAAGRFPFRRTPFDPGLLAFLITAGMGVWAAYDREAAWAKFWVIVSAILFYYALASQSRSNLWRIAGLLGIVAVGMAGYFLLTNDWQTRPAKVLWLDQIGVWWMSVRPPLLLPPIHPNDAAYIMAMTAPFLMAYGLHAHREGQRSQFVAAAGLVLTIVGLLLTTSRGAWLALSGGLGCWLLWYASGLAATRLRRARVWVFLALLSLSGAGLVVVLAGGLGSMLARWLGQAGGTNRLELARNTLLLIADFPFTGGGLRAFPGLYSRYVLVIPDFFLIYSHNLFLDVALEQGVPGLLVFSGVLLGSAWGLIISAGAHQPTGADAGLLRWAVIASWIAVVLHGLVDDTLYGDQGSPIIFLLAGLAVNLTQPEHGFQSTPTANRYAYRPWQKLAWAVSLALLAVGLYGYRHVWLSAWHSNLGAVEMAQAQLAGWPASRWNENLKLSDLSPAEAQFQVAVRLNASNVTARHRLGLVAAAHGDDATAAAQLEQAHSVNPNHRGVRKVLGYEYVWLGQFDRAAVLLSSIPEAGYELGVYAWWWGTQGRDDLAARAAQMAERLDSAHTETDTAERPASSAP
jgi:hypothetical protein